MARRVLRATTAGGPGPPTGSRIPIYYPDPSAGREQTPRLGQVRRRHVSAGAGTRARPRSFLEKTRPPTAFNTGDVGALCHSRARGDFCQAVLLIARYQGAQCSRWHHPRHARQSATPVRHDSSAMEYHNAYAVHPTVYAATYTASTGTSRDGTGEDPPQSESLQGDEAYPAKDSPSL